MIINSISSYICIPEKCVYPNTNLFHEGINPKGDATTRYAIPLETATFHLVSMGFIHVSQVSNEFHKV